MMSNGGNNNISVAAQNDENRLYATLVGGEVFIAGQENSVIRPTVIRPKPILSLDHSSKNKELMDDDQDMDWGTKLSLAPPSFFRFPSLGFIHPHSSKYIELTDEELGTKLSLAPPGFIHPHSSKNIEPTDEELGTKLSLAPPSFFHDPSPGFSHSPTSTQLQQPSVSCNSKPSEILDVFERIRLLERLSYVCSTSTTYGDIDEMGTHENANKDDDQREEPESDAGNNMMDLALEL